MPPSLKHSPLTPPHPKAPGVNRGARAPFYAAACLAILLPACTTRESPKIRLAIGGQAQLIYLAATMAQELGYYKDESLNVELLDFPGGQK